MARILFVACMIATLISCSNDDVTTTDTGPIKVGLLAHLSAGTSAETDVLINQVRRFNEKQTAYQVEMVSVGEAGYEPELEKYAQQNNLPCIVEFDGPFVYNYAWRGLIKPLDRLITADMKNDFLPSIIAQGTYETYLFSLGVYESGMALWGNKKMLNDKGITPPTTIKNAWSLAQFEDDVLKKLKDANTAADFFPLDMKFAYGVGEWYSYGYAPIMQSFGGDLIDRSTLKSSEGVLNSSQTINAFTTVKKWITQNWVNKNQPNGETDFVNKKSALSYVGHWMYQPYKDALGDDLVLIPMPKFGNKAVTGNGSWNYGISTNCKSPEGAWEFLKFILSPEEILTMTRVNGAIPSRVSALNNAPDLFGTNGKLHIYVDQLKGGLAVPRPQTPAYETIRNAFAKAFSESVVGDRAYQDALNEATETIRKDFTDHNNYIFTPPSRY